MAAVAAAIPASAAGGPPFLFEFGRASVGATGVAGTAEQVRGIAADPSTGHIYAASQRNNRIDEFTAWGTFVKAWGWGVEDGSAELQTCTTETDCQQGIGGAGAGQLRSNSGLALDSAGDIYVAERNNSRVQKFDPDGNFVLMFGGEVNKTKVAEREAQEAAPEPVTVTAAEENLCTAASGDECGAGVEGADGEGQFDKQSAVGAYIAIDTNSTEATADDTVYVGEREGIQAFDVDGAFQSAFAVAGHNIGQLAVDPTGNLYLTLCPTNGCAGGVSPEADVRKYSPGGAELSTVTVEEPLALATDSSGSLYVADGDANPTIRKFSSSGSEQASFSGKVEFSISMAVNDVPGASEPALYIANSVGTSTVPLRDAYVNAFGPPPVGFELPPAVAPSIESQAANSVGIESAVVRTRINPHFWQDAKFYVQYGTEACLESGWTESCSAHPASPSGLTAEATNEPVTRTVTLAGLLPHTTYHYRVVAESSGGGPVFGVGGTEGEDGESASFTTFATPKPNTNCPNQQFRTGAAAALPDCRAYEMVSPVEKNGGDIYAYGFPRITGGEEATTTMDQSSVDGGKITYSAAASFAGSLSNAFVNQYISTRVPGNGWFTEAINPPERGGIARCCPASIRNSWHAFTPDLGQAWLVPESSVDPLAPGASTGSGELPGIANLYHRDNSSAGYTDLGSAKHAAENCESFGECSWLFPVLQGYSGDGEKAVYKVNNAITADAVKSNANRDQLYVWSAGTVSLLSVLPSGAASDGFNTAATFSGLELGNGTQVERAVSENASHVYWTAAPPPDSELDSELGGALFLRVNGDQPPSAQEFGSATGTGDLSATSASGSKTAGSTSVLCIGLTCSAFTEGAPIAGSGIPAGATIESVLVINPFQRQLTISAAATESGVGTIVTASKTVTNVSTESGAFAAGQTIEGNGIPLGATIESVGANELTLSAPPTAGGTGVALEAFSDCTEPEKACTIPVSKAVTDGRARFWTASRDGSRSVFSIADGPLAGNLYEFDAESEESSLIAGDSPGVLGAGENLEELYFASEEALTGEGPGEANSEGDFAQSGEPNLYLRSAGELTFVATLSELDRYDFTDRDPSPISPEAYKHLARVTADGDHIAFTSAGMLTDYDNTDAISGQPDIEVYTYEAGGELNCASCNPSGARPVGESLGNGDTLWTAAWIPGYRRSLNPLHPLAEDGSRLFFNSIDALVPRDTNGVEDVYQWEKPGTGDCTESSVRFSAQNNGCVDLISSGVDPRRSQFVDASRDGGNVFIRTESSFAPQDPGLVDIYVARVNGGFPPPEDPIECEGDACQNVPESPQATTPSSSAFEGAGNLNPASAGNCARPARNAQKLSRRAKRLRRHVKRLGNAGKSQRMHRKSRRLARRAHRLSASAKRCRRARHDRRAQR